MNIKTIDCDYLNPRFAASYLLESGGQAAFIEANTAHAVPLLMKALADSKLKPEQVRYLIVTHVHLDHAGGAGELLKLLPNAKLLVHPRGARHLIDPSKLIASATAVYGEEQFARLYGVISPIDESRVQIQEEGSRVQLGEVTLEFLHTRGHANHHFCVFESKSKSIFTGDSFGLVYPEIGVILPSTSPTDFDGELAVQSVQRIVATGAETAYLTHFGPIAGLKKWSESLIAQLESSQKFVTEMIDETKKHRQNNVSETELIARLRMRIKDRILQAALASGVSLGEAEFELLKLDLDLNAQGLWFTVSKALSR